MLPTAGGLGSTPGRGPKILQIVGLGQNNSNKNPTTLEKEEAKGLNKEAIEKSKHEMMVAWTRESAEERGKTYSRLRIYFVKLASLPAGFEKRIIKNDTRATGW